MFDVGISGRDLILIGGGLLLVVGGGGALLFGGGAAAYMAASESIPPPLPPPTLSTGPSGASRVATPPVTTGPAPKGWMKGPESGLPRNFPFSVPRDAEMKTSMGNTSDGLYSAVVIYETSMATDELFERYKAEAEAANMTPFPNREKNGGTLSAMGEKAVMSLSIEEYRNSTTVTITWMPDRGD